MRALLLAVGLIPFAAATAQAPPVWLQGLDEYPRDVLRVGDTLHVFSVQSTVSGILARDVLYHRSVDGGRTFEPVRYLLSNVFATVTTNTNLVANGDDLMFSHAGPSGPVVVISHDGGATWGPPVPIAALPRAPVSARLLAIGPVVVACWNEPRVGPNDVYVATSYDFGATWNPDVRIDTGVPDGDSNYLRLFGDPAAIYVYWQELAGLAPRLQVSFDFGLSWLPAPRVPPNALGTVGVNGTTLCTGFGTSLQYSTDAGASWTPTTFQPSGNPVLAFDGPRGLAAWRAGNLVLTAASQDGGLTWTPHPGSLAPPPSGSLYGAAPFLRGTAAVLTMHYTLPGLPTTYAAAAMVSGDQGASWSPTRAYVPTSSSLLSTLVVGYTPGETLAIITRQLSYSMHCTMLSGHRPYGVGSAGSGGIVPRLQHVGVPVRGHAIGWTIDRCLGGAPVVLGLGFSGQAAIPLAGTTVLVAPPIDFFLQFSNGSVGVPDTGSTSYAFQLPNSTAFIGVRTNWQAAVFDAGIPGSLATTAAAEMWIH